MGLIKIKYAYQFTTGFTPDTNDPTLYDDSENGLRWVTIRDLTSKDIFDTRNKISVKGAEGRRIVKKGALLYSFKLSVGKVSFLQEDSYTNEAIAAFSSYQGNSLDYLYYAAPIYIEKNANINIYGAKILNQDRINNAKIPLPSIDKQKEIAAFLKNKESAINSEISLLEEQISQIRDFKKSFINQQIVEISPFGCGPLQPGFHTSVVCEKAKFLFAFRKGLNITKADLVDDGVPVISYGQTHNKAYQYEFSPKKNDLPKIPLSLADPKALLHSGDFVFADTSEDIPGSGDFSMLGEEELCYCGYHSYFLRAKQPVNPRFFMYFFQSQLWKDQIQASVFGVKVFSITKDLIMNCLLLLPDVTIQKSVVEKCDHQTKYLDDLIAIKEAKINGLKLYFSALCKDTIERNSLCQ